MTDKQNKTGYGKASGKMALLSCPFCGEGNDIGVMDEYVSVTHGRFGCSRCGCSIKYYKYGTFESRSKKWNTRV